MLAKTALAVSLALPSIAAPSVSPPVEPAAGEATLLIQAKRLLVRPGVELENVSVLVEDGRIVAVGQDIEAPEGARVLESEVVCAGFLDPWSSLGVDSTSAGDQRTTPSTRSVDGIDGWLDESAWLDTLRGGVTTVRAQVGVRASIGGIGAVIRLAGSNEGRQVVLDEACLAATVGITRGGTSDIFDRVGEVDRLVGEIDKGRRHRATAIEYRHDLEEWKKALAESVEKLEKDFKKAKKDRDKKKKEAEEKDKEYKEKKYKEDKKPRRPKLDPDGAALARVAEGEAPLVVEIHRHEEIRALLAKTASFDRLRMTIAGGTESLAHAEALAERRIPVLLNPTPLGSRRLDELDHHDLALAGALEEAGVRVLIGSGGRASSRDLRQLAAIAMGHGLSREAAFGAITLAAAESLDLGNRLGSVERGKDADLLLLDGHPLDTTSQIRFVISGGTVVIEP